MAKIDVLSASLRVALLSRFRPLYPHLSITRVIEERYYPSLFVVIYVSSCLSSDKRLLNKLFGRSRCISIAIGGMPIFSGKGVLLNQQIALAPATINVLNG